MAIQVIRMDSNENPLGPSPMAVEAARRALAESNRYPDGASTRLRQRLAGHLNVPPENLVFGNGSTELILLAGQAFLGESDEGITPAVAFPMYAMAVREAGARVVEVPLREYIIDLEAMAAAVTPRTRLLYTANPNNPTGTCFTAAAFENFLGRISPHVLVVLDEAYFDYANRPGYSRSLEWVAEGRNLLVLRTFSKVYGLAGFRIGYGIARPEIIAAFDRVRAPFNTSVTAQAAALAALDDREHVRRSLETNRAGMAQLARGLERIGVPFVPSAGNFILVRLGVDGQAVAEAMLSLGVQVRPMAWMGFPKAIRVTAGLAGENELFLAALAQALDGVPGARIVST
ncbi:MAG TPA: histidinol-phosphate transaminase [Candidatus Acidoferrales bacterium]|nr:histidinol-phosphate transaminase [Candidatus Acidoferrales bacterium]